MPNEEEKLEVKKNLSSSVESSRRNLVVRKQGPKKRLLLTRNNRIYAAPDEKPNCRAGSFCSKNFNINTTTNKAFSSCESSLLTTIATVATTSSATEEVVQHPEIITPSSSRESSSTAKELLGVSQQQGKLITVEREEASLDLWDSLSGSTGTVKRRPTTKITIHQERNNSDKEVSIFTGETSKVIETIQTQPEVNSSQSIQNFTTTSSKEIEKVPPPTPRPTALLRLKLHQEEVSHFSLSKITPSYPSERKDSSRRNMGSILTRQRTLTSSSPSSSSYPKGKEVVVVVPPSPRLQNTPQNLKHLKQQQQPPNYSNKTGKNISNSNRVFFPKSSSSSQQKLVFSYRNKQSDNNKDAKHLQEAKKKGKGEKKLKPQQQPQRKLVLVVGPQVRPKQMQIALENSSPSSEVNQLKVRHKISHLFFNRKMPPQIKDDISHVKKYSQVQNQKPPFSHKEKTKASDEDEAEEEEKTMQKEESKSTLQVLNNLKGCQNNTSHENSCKNLQHKEQFGLGFNQLLSSPSSSSSQDNSNLLGLKSLLLGGVENGFDILTSKTAVPAASDQGESPISPSSRADEDDTHLVVNEQIGLESGGERAQHQHFQHGTNGINFSTMDSFYSTHQEERENYCPSSNNGSDFYLRESAINNNASFSLHHHKEEEQEGDQNSQEQNLSSVISLARYCAFAKSLDQLMKLGKVHSKKIYTDWANHYLEKARCKRHIQDLQVDVTDGVILADVVEAVTSHKVADVVRKPKNSSQMLDNIQASLVYLTNLGVSLEGISARDIRDGHLKSILSLFFQLSRFKQQQKQQDRDRHNLQRQNGETHNNIIMMQQSTGMKNTPASSKDLSKLPSAFGCKPHTSIPLPASGLANGQSLQNSGLNHGGNNPSALSMGNSKKSSQQDKGKSGIMQHQHHHTYANTAGSVPVVVKPASGSSSRSTSPSASGGLPHSFIPTPRSSIPSAPSSARSSLHEKHLNNAKNSSIAGPPSSNKSSVRAHNNNSVNSVPPHSSTLVGSSNSSNGSVNSTNAKNNTSMLEKFKFFKDKDKGEKLKSSTGSKRTSSSSGFSSARSERSDSSVSLCSESKTGSVEGSSSGGVILLEREKERDHSGGNNGSIIPQSSVVGPSGDSTISNVTSTPRLAIKGFRQKIGKAIASKDSSKGSHQSSPKSSRKQEVEVASSSLVSSSNGPAKGLPSSTKLHSSETKKSTGSDSQENKHPGGGKVRGGKSSEFSTTDSTSQGPIGGNSSVSAPSVSGQGFLRQPKPSSVSAGVNGSSRDSRNRFSGTGIPTRNSLIVTNNSSSRDELHHSNGLVHNDTGSNSSVHSSMSSINGLVQSAGGNGTGIPKPTAAVKGTTKHQQQISKEQSSSLSNGPSHSTSKEGLKDCQTTNNTTGLGSASSSNNKIKPANNINNANNKISHSSSESQPSSESCPAKVSISSGAKSSSSSQRVNDSPKDNSIITNEESQTGNKSSSSRPAVSITKATSNNSGGSKSGESVVVSGITVAMIAPMPSLTNSVSNSASVSSVESSSVSLSQSQLSSLSHSNSNSSETSVILATKGVPQIHLHQLQQSSSGVENSSAEKVSSESHGGFPNPLEIISDNNNAGSSNSSSSKVSPMSVFGCASGSSSMGSLKCAVESSSCSGASSSGEFNTNAGDMMDNTQMSQGGGGSGLRSHRPVINLSPNNGNEAIPECDEDELLLNVTPMEPLTYEYIKSPPSGHQTPGFLSPKSGGVNGCSSIQMSRMGPCENGNRLNRQMFNPYGPNRLIIRKDVNREGGKYGHYASSSVGDHDYTEIDNLDINSAGYVSDGDLLPCGSNGNRSNDGYLSESATSMYPRRQNQQNYRKDEGSSGTKSHHTNHNNNKHGLIPEDSFDDSSSISSGISDLNEIPTDVTSSSVNSELSSPYSSLQRGSEDANSFKNGQELHKQIDPQSIIYRVVGSRNRRSTESSKNSLESLVVRTSKTNQIQGENISSSGSGQKEFNACLKSGSGGGYPVSSGDHSRGVIARDKYHHGGSSSVSSSLGTGANNGIQSVVYPQQFSSSGSHKRSLNNLDAKGKKGMIGLKEEYYGREMADRLMKEEIEHDRHRSHSHGGSNGNSSGGGINNGDGKRAHSAKITQSANSQQQQQQQQHPNFGYVRRSTGSGIGGSGHSVSNTKYSIPVNGNGKVTLSGMKEMLTAEEFKAANAALAVAAGTSSPHHHTLVSPYSVLTAAQHSNSSPKTRTKVKVSGGTQTTNDLHDLSGGRHQTLGHSHHPGQHYQQHYGQHSSNTSEVDYASSTCSRNSGSFISSRNDPNATLAAGSAAAYKSLSLTTPTATQLSQTLRERILGSQSLPKGATAADYAALLAAIQQKQQHQQIYGTPNASKDRMSRYLSCKTMMNDDTSGYSNYSEIQAYALSAAGAPNSNPYSYNMRHSTGYASSITSAPTRMGAGSMTEAESMESISSSSSMAAHLRDNRSNGVNQGRASAHPKETSPSQSPRLNRSNSIRSTKSEKLYPSMLQRTEDVGPYYSSTIAGGGADNLPTSPSHGTPNRMGGGSGQGPYLSTPASNHSMRLSMSPYPGFLTKISTNKEDEINGSSLSLISTASSIYSSQEDKQAHEVRKLRRDLIDAQEKVQTLSNQLSTNAHVVAAFEQSLSNMTQRIQSLTSSAEQKDTELIELRQTIELLRKQSIEAGLTVASMTAGMSRDSRDGSPIARQLSADSVSSINSISSACSCTSHSHTSSPSGQVQMTPLGTPTHGANANCVPPDSPNLKKKHAKNKGWLRSSFTKAFSRSKGKGGRNGSMSDADGYDNMVEGMRRPSDLNGDSGSSHSHHHGMGQTGGHHHLQHNGHSHSHKPNCNKHGEPPGSPLLSPPQSNGCSSSSGSHSPRSNSGTNVSSGVCEDFGDENKSVDELKKQLREKEMVLTDIRLEALTSAHQLESLKETVNKMRNEMLSLKQDNERLQRMVTSKSLTSSQSSLQMGGSETIDRRLSASEVPPPSSSNLDVLLCEASDKEGKRIVVTVFLGCHGSYERYVNNTQEGFPTLECNIGSVSVSSKTKWDVLDAMIKRAFKEYLTRVDPVSNLGLSAESIFNYNVGEVVRSKEGTPPELLPCGYLVGDVTKIRVCLRGALQSGSLDALAFETLVPKSILQRYITLLADHGRIILCGPSGTGKSYLARKIGEFLVARCGKDPCPEAIATFSADHKNNKELRQYLANLAEQCESGSADLPSVIILDNLHQVSSFGEVFSGYLNSKQSGGPVIIGTMSQSTASTANLQLHHNFRWVLFGNHMEPVKGLLSRYLQRRLVEVDVQNANRNVELSRVMDWIPKVWYHINKFLEIHNSSEVTIGPRLFLSCPTDVANSQVWFTDLWHYSIVPYLIEAVKEGLQLYGRKAPWEDPCQFLLQTYPWSESHSMSSGKSSLLRLRPEDVGYDMKSEMNSTSGKQANKQETGDQDPLMNMLMRLQEAANYSGPQSNESDSTHSHGSLDSKDYITTA